MAQWDRFASVLCGAVPPLLLPACVVLLLGGCEMGPPDEPGPEPIRPVRVAEVVELGGGEAVTLTGAIEAEDNISLAFGGPLLLKDGIVGRNTVAMLMLPFMEIKDRQQPRDRRINPGGHWRKLGSE